jgi:hypothetical protein
LPPENIRAQWQEDYKTMSENMFYNQSLPFDKLMEKLSELQHKINQLQWNIVL